jgi:hypothetical protein
MVDRRTGFNLAPDDNVDECPLKRIGLAADPLSRERACNIDSVSHSPSDDENG